MPQTMFEDPDGTLEMLRDSVAVFAKRNDGPQACRSKTARGDDIDRSIWSSMAAAGWIGLLLSEELGGAGLGVREQAVLSEALGRALIAEPTSTASVLASVLLNHASPTAERERLAGGLIDGGAIVVPAWQDAVGPAGTEPASAEATADGFALFGGKRLIEGARSATDFLVAARSPDRALLLSVPADTSGLSVAERPGIDGATLADVSFAGCRVDAKRLIAAGDEVDRMLDAASLLSRLSLAAELAGVASKALELTMAYTKERVQFGKPIASFQVIQHRLVDMWIDAEFACSAVVNAVELLEDNAGREAHLAVLAAKARAGEAAFSICRRAVHLFGAMGFTDECDIGLYLKRAINLNASLGQPEALRLEFVDLERAA